MEERPVEPVVERIDAALARIERAVARDRQALGALQASHEGLKLSVSEALGEIDALLGQGRE